MRVRLLGGAHAGLIAEVPFRQAQVMLSDGRAELPDAAHNDEEHIETAAAAPAPENAMRPSYRRRRRR